MKLTTKNSQHTYETFTVFLLLSYGLSNVTAFKTDTKKLISKLVIQIYFARRWSILTTNCHQLPFCSITSCLQTCSFILVSVQQSEELHARLVRSNLIFVHSTAVPSLKLRVRTGFLVG